MSGNNPNLDYLSSLGVSLLPQSGSTSGSNFTSFTHVQTSPRVTTRTTINNLTAGGTQGRSRSASHSPNSTTRNNIITGKSEINIADNVTMKGENIIAGASYVDMRKGSKGPKNEHDDFHDRVDKANLPTSDVTINVGNNVSFIANNSIIFGASYVRIDNEIEKITDEEIKERYHELMAKLDGKLNVGSDESDENAAKKIKDVIRRTPGSIVKICSSICLILWDDGNRIGTGFLARIPEFKDVVLLTAGHNFKPKENYEDHFLYFKATDGDENGKGVLQVPLANLLHRKFSLVTTCKGKRTIISRTAGASDCEGLNHNAKKGDDVNQDLDYCMISLPGFEEFMKKNKLQCLEVKDDVEKAERVFYVGHPYMGFPIGDYIRDNADIHNEEHYATLKVVDKQESVYEWKNEKGESWKLYPTGEQDRLRVDQECPHYKSGYKEAEFSSNIKYGKFVLGPDKVPYCWQTTGKEEEDKMAKALRFSYGAMTADEDIKIKYTLDTKAGASGSPVLGDDYSVSAIHTFWNNKDKISGGVKIAAVMKDLQELKKSYPSHFTDEPETNFQIEADESTQNFQKWKCVLENGKKELRSHLSREESKLVENRNNLLEIKNSLHEILAIIDTELIKYQ